MKLNVYENTEPMLLKKLKIDTHCAVLSRNHLDRYENTEQLFYRQCVETIQGEPKLKLYFPMVMEYPTIVLGNCSKQ